MNIGDQFKAPLDKYMAKRTFRVAKIDEDGSIVAHDIDEVQSNRLETPVLFCFGVPTLPELIWIENGIVA